MTTAAPVIKRQDLSGDGSDPGEMQAARAVRALLQPRAIALIGASRARSSVGGELLHNLLDGDFHGPVYPINPASTSIQGVRAYASVSDVPDPIDLAIIAVPVDSVAQAARECAAKGVGSVVVVSSGFSEIGPAGAGRQAELVEVCQAAGMRLVGPNCMGIANTAPDVRMNAQFAPIAPPPGRVGVLSQSGALGLALIHEAAAIGVGLSSFVSLGNQADLTGDDFLAYWETDPRTDAVLLYLESIAQPRQFARIARRVARSKPIVAVKSGRSAAGARATSSHTGALIGASDLTVDALFEQAGVIRTDTLAEMFDVAALISGQPLPAGRRVAILTNGGGPGILAADACDAAGLQVPPLDASVRQALAEHLPALAGVTNPVDMIASATPDDYARAMELIATDPGIDSLLVISGPPLATPTADLAAAIRDARARMARPITVAAVFMSTELPRAALIGPDVTIPAYSYPENASYALARAVRYAEWRRTPQGRVPGLRGIRPKEAKAVLEAAMRRGTSRWLSAGEVRSLLAIYGFPLIEQVEVQSAAEAAAAAQRMGGSVAVKAVSSSVVHKSEARGVRLNLNGATEVEPAANEIAAAYAAAGHVLDGFLVQRMAPAGVEMLAGVVHDQLFGPVVACAAGGTQAELMRDVAVRITPLSDSDAHQMVGSLASSRLLEGLRGAPKLDRAALEEVLLRISALVDGVPEIAEMDLNPVVVLPTGATIVDARIRIEPHQPL